MNNENSFDRDDARERLSQAAQSGENLATVVRDITLQALSSGRFDRTQIKSVVQHIVDDVKHAMAPMNEATSRERWREVFSGLDTAMKSAAKAGELAVTEAGNRVEEFAKSDLENLKNDLSALEDLLLDSISDIAKRTEDMTSKVLTDLVAHARNSGTQVGEQIQSSLSVLSGELTRGGEQVVKSGLDAARHASADLAQVASGLLAGIAESLRPHSKPPGDTDKE